MERLPKEVATTILLTVYRGEKLTMSDLAEKTRFSTITVLNHVNALIQANLLAEEREGTFPRRRLVKASEEGLRVASLLNAADGSRFGTKELVDMGAKAGRMASYQETISQLRAPNTTRDYLVAELMLKMVAGLASGIMAVSKGLPESMAEMSEKLRSLSSSLEAHHAQAQRLLSAGNVSGCGAEVSKALVEFNGASESMKEVVGLLRGMRMDEVANVAEFLSPKAAKKA
jgi:DNA-binding MarR family transcriptional regulator